GPLFLIVSADPPRPTVLFVHPRRQTCGHVLLWNRETISILERISIERELNCLIGVLDGRREELETCVPFLQHRLGGCGEVGLVSLGRTFGLSWMRTRFPRYVCCLPVGRCLPKLPGFCG